LLGENCSGKGRQSSGKIFVFPWNPLFSVLGGILRKTSFYDREIITNGMSAGRFSLALFPQSVFQPPCFGGFFSNERESPCQRPLIRAPTVPCTGYWPILGEEETELEALS